MGPKTQQQSNRQSFARISGKHGLLKRLAALCIATSVGISSTASAVPGVSTDVYLKAQAFDKPLPDGTISKMWGFATCDATYTTCLAPDAPANQIDATLGMDLNIHVRNALDVPISVTIPSLPGAGAGQPIFTTDKQGRRRMRSFIPEVAAGGNRTYTWAAAKLHEGTFLYQSGTQPSIQVPMGLYGPLVIHPAATAAACAAGQSSAYGHCYNSETVVVMSEVDRVQNNAVHQAVVDAVAAATTAGTPVDLSTIAYPSVVDYNPTNLLVKVLASSQSNRPATGTQPATAAHPKLGNPGDTVLLRLLNAGSRTHNPSITGLNLGLLAEDGHPYPGTTIKQQSVLMLPAGKTLDTLATLPAGDVTLSMYDRMPAFTNNALSNSPQGGVTALAQVNSGIGSAYASSTGKAVDDAYTLTEDQALAAGGPAVPGVLANDDGLSGAAVDRAPQKGTLTLNPDGSFTYTPKANYFGKDIFTYKASDAMGNIYSAVVSLTINNANDAPEAFADNYSNSHEAGILNVSASAGVLGNDKDVDGDTLKAVLDAAGTPSAGYSAVPAGSLTLNTDGSFSLGSSTSKVAPGDYSFFYHNVDAAGVSSNSVEVKVHMKPASGIALTVTEPNGTPVTAYRWTLEKDNMWHPQPGVTQPNNSLATSMHKSNMPVIAQGCVGCPNADENLTLDQVALDAPPAGQTEHYYVSVMPLDGAAGLDPVTGQGGHTLGGAAFTSDDTAVTVNVNKQPMGYAQISIIIFEDNAPPNGAIDGNEPGLGGFQITLEDGGGRYGMSAGLLSFDANGNPLKNYLDCFGANPPPQGVIISCPDTPDNRLKGLVGQVLIKNLYPGKYGVIATPPADGVPDKNNPGVVYKDWVQTTTIEGTKIVDAWVKPNEPPFFAEFGPAGWHVFHGFISPSKVAADTKALGVAGNNTIHGFVTNNHMSRPPNQSLWDSGNFEALSHTRPWISLNSAGGQGASYAVEHATLNPDGTAEFTFTNVPDGTYQLSVWDDYLDLIFYYSPLVDVRGGVYKEVTPSKNLPVFNWFAGLKTSVFMDLNENGKRDVGEVGIPEVPVNLRWRDGTMYQQVPTDGSGEAPFDELFPFFNWQVAEVDYASYKATGMTAVVDAGGDVSATGHVLNPQVQADGTTSRTETGPVLTQGFQAFLGQTSTIEWGKAPYKPGENGGITGVVYYASTRAEADPRLGVAEPWEPGIPDVKVRLYRKVQTGTDASGKPVYGHILVDETVTDNWEKNLPTGCPGASPIDPVTPNDKCYDGLRNFNQIRPAVFDGGYAFGRAAGKPDLEPGTYVVEVIPPAGYDLVKEEDVNVTFGETFGAVPQMVGSYTPPALPDMASVANAKNPPQAGITQPKCVGDTHVVPAYLSLFPDNQEPAPYANALRNTCDKKEVILDEGAQAAADFFLYTKAPIAGHFVGIILDDTAQEFNKNSPQFGEKWAPPFVPVAVLDPLGKEIGRVYSDEWGAFNGLLPSTYSANAPSPSGFSPSMLMTCMNHPGPIKDKATGQMVVDPQYNPMYSTFCYTMQYMPGTTTYLDTPVLPVAAYASGYNPPDCAKPEFTPMISSVDGNGSGPFVTKGGTLTINSVGSLNVPNPDYNGPAPMAPLVETPKTIKRNYGFGTAAGTVTLIDNAGVRIPATVGSWSDTQITVTAPMKAGEYQLEVTSANGMSTTEAVTVTVDGGTPAAPIDTPIRVAAGGSIQDAIDTAADGQLILVAPGVYNEELIMWHPVRLQGAGAGSTIINALRAPVDKINQWRVKMDKLFAAGVLSTLPHQPAGSAGFITEEGAGITVVGVNGGPSAYAKHPSRIDGFSITGADVGGGVFVNGYADNLMISNNRVFGNHGAYGGGIRVGRPFLQLTGDQPFGFNKNVRIHHNTVKQNGGQSGAGGGISIATGTDRYRVDHNYICGNYTLGHGGGIAHFGRSDRGVIDFNKVVLNQSFSQMRGVNGGGIYIGGEPARGGFSLGSGDVTVDANLIQGNQAAGGHGGGIRTQFVNGIDVSMHPQSRGRWYKVKITNNMIVNNVAGFSGGGISMQDTLRGVINNNTIVHNDSTATVAGAFTTGNINLSASQPAGIAVEANTPSLDLAIPADRPKYKVYTKPVMRNNIVWQNRAFHYDATTGTGVLMPALTQTTTGACDPNADYWDLGVVGVPGATLDPRYSVLTNAMDRNGNAYHKTNKYGDPMLVNTYCNGGRGTPGPLYPLPSLDEGGNAWIDVRFGPLKVMGDHHIASGLSSAVDSANEGNAPKHDFDNEPRPQPNNEDNFDIGADEVALQAPKPGTILSFSSAAPYPIIEGGTLLDFGEFKAPRRGRGTLAPVVATVTLKISHTPVTINSLQIKARKARDVGAFTVMGGTCQTGGAGLTGPSATGAITVPVGGTCTVQVQFQPTGRRDREAKLLVNTNLFQASLKLLGK